MGEHLYISTGEVSGEQHAAGLVAAMREHCPSLRFTGMGGDILRSAGVETILDMDTCRVMGFWEILKYLPRLRTMFRVVLNHLECNRPRALILVDYPGFHLRLARMVKKRFPDLPIVYYIAPKVWAWNERRIKKLRAYVDQMFVIFPFEEAYFSDRGVPATYVGNPTWETIRQIPDTPPHNIKESLGIVDGKRIIALFPGSRPAELERLLPVMLEAGKLAQQEYTDLQCIVSAAPGISQEKLERAAHGPLPFPVYTGDSHALMKASTFLVAKSGTTTLEAALLGIPMVVVYRAHPVSAWIGRRVIRCGWFSLPNIVAQKTIVRELFQEDVTPEAIVAEIREALASPTAYQKKREDLLALQDLLGTTPAFTRATDALMEYLGIPTSGR